MRAAFGLNEIVSAFKGSFLIIDLFQTHLKPLLLTEILPNGNISRFSLHDPDGSGCVRNSRSI